MRSIQVSTEVFAAIWSNRQEGEEDESTILSRILAVGVERPTPNRGKSKIRWVDDVVAGLEQLGGEAEYGRIYEQVRQVRLRGGRSIPRSFEEVIRKEIETHSSDSDAYAHREDLFCAPQGKGAGVWALRNRPTGGNKSK